MPPAAAAGANRMARKRSLSASRTRCAQISKRPASSIRGAVHAHATAIKPAATRRPSASRILKVRTAGPVGMVSTVRCPVAECSCRNARRQQPRIPAGADQNEIEISARGKDRRQRLFVDQRRGAATGHAQMPSAGTTANRDATCRQSESRHCHRHRSAPARGKCGCAAKSLMAHRQSVRLRAGDLARSGSGRFRFAADSVPWVRDAEIDQQRRGDEGRRIGADNDAEQHRLHEALDHLRPEQITGRASRGTSSSR